MKVKLTISKRIGLGFAILTLLTMANFFLTIKTLFKSRSFSEQIVTVYTPSVDALEDLHAQILNTNKLINYWLHVQSSDDNPDKQKLKEYINSSYPAIKKQINELAINWTAKERSRLESIFYRLDSLYILHQDIMTSMNSFAAYEDASVVFLVRPVIEDVNSLTKDIIKSLTELIAIQHDNTQRVSNSMIDSFNILQAVVFNSGFILVIGGIIIALLTIKSIVKPIQQLQVTIKAMAKGILPEENMSHHDDEIGDMTEELNLLIDGMKRTSEFSREVGSGNFDSNYVPLSKDDALGNSLLLMRAELKELTGNLEAKVQKRTDEIQEQRKILEKLYTDQTDSIIYAKRIQESILPSESSIKKYIPQSFIYFKPRNIISGDFYWFEHNKDYIYLASVDCTGHGVPGALMSIIGHDLLDNAIIVNPSITAGEVLDHLNKELTRILRIGADDAGGAKDGMDISLCRIDVRKQQLQYAGAYNPLYIVRNGELIETKADKRPIGIYAFNKEFTYTTHTFDIQANDVFYIFSDGYPDQFGGPLNKKLMYKNFRELLVRLHKKPMHDQNIELEKFMNEWRKDEDQVDDQLILGFKVEK